jgi:hypothetical protein
MGTNSSRAPGTLQPSSVIEAIWFGVHSSMIGMGNARAAGQGRTDSHGQCAGTQPSESQASTLGCCHLTSDPHRVHMPAPRFEC